jgi:hypothetical protein
MSRGLKRISSRGSSLSAAGKSESASRPWSSSDAAVASDRLLAQKTPFTTRRWFERPSARSSAEVRAASAIAPISGRVTRMIVVDAGSLNVAIAVLKRASCIFRPECGPRQEAP